MNQVKKLSMVFMIVLVIFIGCQPEDAGLEYKYYSQDKLKDTLDQESPLVILDIQVEEEFNAHHIDGAIATYAFPVKSDQDKAKLEEQLDMLEATEDDIVIVCPMGRIGAERTYQYLIEKGISAERLFILEDGQAGWTSDIENAHKTDEIEETESDDT
ncbi:rhodanese-like domain-containing protein [Acidaminobacter sp. JC074]|uniref:rhodanese-like domain-containing protein n=1 Tax=Acidaminobacter sp. JC074 TaxID=2530199 RepID=UPI001F0FA34B|nr:rhodanese-like domain-containing protein [Acidaminobacter sp. JC074]MCH4888354.1 rhodanese-like domain-containing protein [Acidaminobacter sp. JC074]